VQLSDASAREWANLLNQIVLADLGDTLWSDYGTLESDIRCALVNASGASAARSSVVSIADGAPSGELLIRQMIAAAFPIEVLNALYSGTIPLNPSALDIHSSDCSDCAPSGPCCAGVDLGPVACNSQLSVDSTYQLSSFPSEWPCVSGYDPFAPSYVRVFVADGCELTIVLTDITTAELNITQPYTEPTPGTLVFTSVGAEVGFSNSNPTPFNYTARLREI
jgi:hypothetical protein